MAGTNTQPKPAGPGLAGQADQVITAISMAVGVVGWLALSPALPGWHPPTASSI